MTMRSAIMTIVLRDDLNFLLTNRVPRRTLTRLTGWFSRIEQPATCRYGSGAFSPIWI